MTLQLVRVKLNWYKTEHYKHAQSVYTSLYMSLSVWLTDPLGFEQFEGDCGCPSASALGGDDDLALVIFSRTHSTHYLTSRHPFSC